jgi:hypothetical protein
VKEATTQEPVVQEPVVQDAVIEPPEQTFQPATASAAPELAWTEEPSDIELDDESSMSWDEPKAPSKPTPAVSGSAAELPASQGEESSAPLTKKELKAAKNKAKQDRKDQIKAAKNPRHSND